MKIADSVWHRVVQVVQEGMLTGTDVSDSFRQIEVEPDEADENVLVLTAAYQKQVREMHEKMLKHIEEVQAQRAAEELINSNKSETPN